MDFVLATDWRAQARETKQLKGRCCRVTRLNFKFPKFERIKHDRKEQKRSEQRKFRENV